jgi:hypothetical protein
MCAFAGLGLKLAKTQFVVPSKRGKCIGGGSPWISMSAGYLKPSRFIVITANFYSKYMGPHPT